MVDEYCLLLIPCGILEIHGEVKEGPMDLGAQLFYKCQFDLSLTEYSENRDLLWEIVLEVTGWIKSKHYHILDKSIDMTRLKCGTGKTPLAEKSEAGKRITIKSAMFQDGETVEWGAQIEEDQQGWYDEETHISIAPRKWTTEISYRSVSQQDKGVFSLILSYQDRPGFLGPTSSVPKASVPRLVRFLTADENLYCSKSDFDIAEMLTKVAVRAGSGVISASTFWKLVTRSDREYPIVYIALDKETGKPAIDPAELDEELYPNALICYPTDVIDDDAIQRVCPIPELRCYTDSVRVYQTRPNFTRENIRKEFKRHRYFTRRNMDDLPRLVHGASGDPLIFLLRQALSQDVHFYETEEFITVDDVIRHKKVAEIRNDLEAADERLSEYRSRISNLRRDIAERQRALHEREEHQDAISEETEDFSAQLEDEKNRRLQSERDAEAALDLAEQTENELKQMQVAYSELCKKHYSLTAKYYGLNNESDAEENNQREQLRKTLTAELPEVFSASGVHRYDSDRAIVELFAKLYDDRIIVSDRAWSSLKECVTSPSLCWKAMMMVCRPLWQAYAESEGNINEIFRQNPETLAGFDVALSEGRETRKNPQLMRLRELSIDGKQYSIEPHLKKGSKDDSDSIRIYYAWDGESQKIVLGSIGKHLTNYTSRSIH